MFNGCLMRERSMRIVKKTSLYLRAQRRMIENNRQEIEKANGSLAHALLAMGCLLFLFYLGVSFTVDSYRDLSVPYALMLAFLAAMLIAFPWLKRRISTTSIIYVCYGALVAYAIYTSAFVTPAYTSVIILFFIFQVPLITLDKSWRVDIMVALYAAAYLLVAVPYKDQRLKADEILNCLLFTFLGIALGEKLRWARLENFELKRQAMLRERTDYLTGLNNRKRLFEELARIENGPQPAPMGLMMLDIDFFKAYNDTYGHQAGDDCLRRLGTCFRDFARRHQLAFYRYGGEEFVVLAPAAGERRLLALSESLRAAVKALAMIHASNATGLVTVSIGLAFTLALTPEEERTLLSRADIALYTAKDQGRDRAVAYRGGMSMPCDNSYSPSFRARN